jgi:hypothetical protein
MVRTGPLKPNYTITLGGNVPAALFSASVTISS